MHIQELAQKNICILGFGREGQATLRALEKHFPDAEITIADQNEEITLDDDSHWLQLGTGWLENLSKFDIIIKSPGIPPQPEFDAVQDKITNSSQIFLDTVSKAGSTVIGVTGSKGKSTTASLLYEILQAAGKDVHLVGNIGRAALDYLGDAKEDTFFVMEMSSYQLMEVETSPQVAVITAIFEEHLDYHKTFENYKEAKRNIIRFQQLNDIAFYDALPGMTVFVDEIGKGKKVPYRFEDCPVKIEDTKLIGRHNIWNMAAATRVAKHLGVPDDVIIATIKNFEGLPHRLQALGKYHGIFWVDDAISTTPESTIAAIEAMHSSIGSIILGGQDRGNDFTKLGKLIATVQNIHHIILFPESGFRIEEAIEKILKELFMNEKRDPLTFHEVTSMQQAVAAVKGCKECKGKICLLSPASPSYGLFKNFEEKGDKFAQCIRGA